MIDHKKSLFFTLTILFLFTACNAIKIQHDEDIYQVSGSSKQVEVYSILDADTEFPSLDTESPRTLDTTGSGKDQDMDQEEDPTSNGPARPEGWQDETHGDDVEPNYDIVFPQDQVNRLDITIDPDNWSIMMADMTARYGEFGSQPRDRRARLDNADLPQDGEQVFPGDSPPEDRKPPTGEWPSVGEFPPGGEPPPGEFPQPGNLPPGGDLPPRAGHPGGGGMGLGGMMEGDEHNPVWITATVVFDGDTWSNVGIRFKGNSSLFSSWGSGNLKLPIKMDFDQFEDDYPEIDDQRFYGFKQLSLASNFHDSSFLREKVAADIFREAAVPAAETAFYQVYIDYGESPVYFGLYTMVEVVDDTVIKTQFSDDGGNVYKPSGRGASFAFGTFDQQSFDKETNLDEADWSDVSLLYETLHADNRISNPEEWRSDLEAIFDVDGFLKWLAVNTVIQNWDSYGGIAHNYYLYNHPTSGKLTWIPWDNNESLKSQGMRNSLSISLSEIDADWPLIRFLMDDPQYQSIYADHVNFVITEVFYPEKMETIYQEFHELIKPYVVGSDREIEGFTHLASEAEFEDSLNELINHTKFRYEAVRDYLNNIEDLMDINKLP